MEELNSVRAALIDREGSLGSSVRIRVEGKSRVLVDAVDQEDHVCASNLGKALAVGFSFDEAKELLSPENYLGMVPMVTELPPRDKRKRSGLSKSRLLSFKALNLRVVRNFTGVNCKVHDNNLWILGPTESVTEASREIRQIVMGRTRGTVQQYHRAKHGQVVKRFSKRYNSSG